MWDRILCLTAWQVTSQIGYFDENMQRNQSKIDTGIYQKVSNISIKKNVEELSKWLKSIATALDAVQKNTCIISEAVTVWKKIRKRF